MLLGTHSDGNEDKDVCKDRSQPGPRINRQVPLRSALNRWKPQCYRSRGSRSFLHSQSQPGQTQQVRPPNSFETRESTPCQAFGPEREGWWWMDASSYLAALKSDSSKRNSMLPPRFDWSPEILKAPDSLCSLFDLCLLGHPGNFKHFSFSMSSCGRHGRPTFGLWAWARKKFKTFWSQVSFASLLHADAVSFVKAQGRGSGALPSVNKTTATIFKTNLWEAAYSQP